LINGDLFISKRVIDIADNIEDEIAFLIACEIANILMGKSTDRCFKIISNSHNFFYANKKYTSHELNSDTINSFITTKENKFLCFYPESILGNINEEFEIMKVALTLLHRAKYNLDQVIYKIV
jgi:hypothetical protein